MNIFRPKLLFNKLQRMRLYHYSLVKEFVMDCTQTYIAPYLIKLSISANTYNKMAVLSCAIVCTTIMSLKYKAFFTQV